MAPAEGRSCNGVEGHVQMLQCRDLQPRSRSRTSKSISSKDELHHRWRYVGKLAHHAAIAQVDGSEVGPPPGIWDAARKAVVIKNEKNAFTHSDGRHVRRNVWDCAGELVVADIKPINIGILRKIHRKLSCDAAA